MAVTDCFVAWTTLSRPPVEIVRVVRVRQVAIDINIDDSDGAMSRRVARRFRLRVNDDHWSRTVRTFALSAFTCAALLA